MENSVNNPLSLSSLSMEAILKGEFSSRDLSFLPNTLLDDILALQNCEGTYSIKSYSENFQSLPGAPFSLEVHVDRQFPWSWACRHLVTPASLVVARQAPGSWSVGHGELVLGRGIWSLFGLTGEFVCWLEGTTIRKAEEIQENQQENVFRIFTEVKFRADELEIKSTIKTEEMEKIVKAKYVKV